MKRFPSNPDDPAFPCDVNKTHKGLTKREFAAIIMCNGVFGIADVDKLFVKLNNLTEPEKEELEAEVMKTKISFLDAINSGWFKVG